MKHLLPLLFLLLSLPAVAQTTADGADASLWSYHLSYHRARLAVAKGNVVYAVFNGNLLRYDAEDQSVQTLDKLSAGLTGKNVTRMQYSDTEKCLVLLYEDGNIDLLFDDGTVVNLPQIKNFVDYAITPTNLNVNGRWATVSTSEGVIVVDLERREIRGFYRFMHNVRDAVVLGTTVYAARSSQVMYGDLSDNLYDLSQWKTYATGLTATRFVGHGENAFLLVPYVAGQTDAWSGLCYLGAPDALGNRQLTRLTEIVFADASRNGNRFTFFGSANLVGVDGANPTALAYSMYTGLWPQAVAHTDDGTFYQAEDHSGLVAYRAMEGNEGLRATGEVIGRFGPTQDGGYDLTLSGGALYVAGGAPNFLDVRTSGFLGRLKDGEWDDMDQAAAAAASPQYANMLAPAVDPNDPDHVFAPSYGMGLYEYRDGKFQTLYSLDNSPLVSASGTNRRYVRLGGSAFDAEGNLWIANNHADSALVVRHPDGSWHRVYAFDISMQRMLDKLRIDGGGRLWLNISAATTSNGGGIFGFDYGGTITNHNDDRSRIRFSATNEDGTVCDLSEVQDLAVDRDGQIWFGCPQGVFAITDPDEWFSDDFVLYQPKVPRNDGTDYADYLLTGVTVRSLAVDGGNRKWLGTLGAGLYLASADGSAVLAHFTAADTPLLSDNVLSLRYDDATGVLYILTDLGLCTYRTGVTAPAATLSKSDVTVSPNPVRPEYHGRITISGLTEGAEVKIVSTGSQLVARGTATGGTFLWDGTSPATGDRVAPGVYFVYVSTADGKQSVAAKFVII